MILILCRKEIKLRFYFSQLRAISKKIKYKWKKLLWFCDYSLKWLKHQLTILSDSNKFGLSCRLVPSLALWNARVLSLVYVALVFLGKAFWADIALKRFQRQVAPYVIFHIAEYLCAVIALLAEKNLIVAASLWVNNGSLGVLSL